MDPRDLLAIAAHRLRDTCCDEGSVTLPHAQAAAVLAAITPAEHSTPDRPGVPREAVDAAWRREHQVGGLAPGCLTRQDIERILAAAAPHMAGLPVNDQPADVTHLRGPWIPVLTTEDGALLDHPDELEDGQCAEVSIRRGTAAPAGDALPAECLSGDVLYEGTDLYRNTYDPTVSVDARWQQAKAIARLLNDTYPDSPERTP